MDSLLVIVGIVALVGIIGVMLRRKSEVPRRSGAGEMSRTTVYYAPFGRRFLARLVDLLIFLPMTVASWQAGSSKALAIAFAPLLPAVWLGYEVCLHATSGQTIGKRVARVRVVRVDQERISWPEAFLRSSVDILFLVLTSYGVVRVLLALPDSHFALPWLKRSATEVAAYPRWLRWTSKAGTAWAWSELLIMLSNRKRRALHDFIAGTIVVWEAPVSAETP